MIRYKFIDERTVVPIDYTLELSVIKNQYEETLENNGITDKAIFSIKKKKKRNEKDNEKLKLRLTVEDEFSKRIDELDEFKELIEEDSTLTDLGELDINLAFYTYDKSKDLIIRRWKVEKNNRSLVLNKIENLKQLLTKSDVKLNKCVEAQLLGSEIPYDVKSLISERQSQRDEINYLESLLRNRDETDLNRKLK